MKQLLSRFSSGDREAGYELLGRQASIREWGVVLAAFASEPADVDLERVAGSTLGRQLEIVASLMDVLTASGTAQALFIAHATTALREEPQIVRRAGEIEEQLLEKNRVFLEEVGDETGLDSLYTLLSLPLPAQREGWRAWGDESPEAVATMERAIGDEDDRLQQLSKERSYRAGTYLHFLRHALANLVLVARIGGPIGRRAFALLQRRVDDAERQEELIRTMPAETARRYIDWSLEPKNAAVVPRTRFALRMVREHVLDGINSQRLQELCGASDPDVAVEAALTGIAIGADGRSFDLEVARLLNSLDLGRAERLANAVVQVPERLNLGLVGPDRRSLLTAGGDSLSPEFCREIVRQVLELPAPEIGSMVSHLDQMPALPPDGLLAGIATGLLQLGRADDSYSSALIESLNSQKFRSAVWDALPGVEDDRRRALTDALIDAETFDERAPRVLNLLRALDGESQEATSAAMLEALFDGKLDAESIAAAWPAESRPTAISAAWEETRRSELENERAAEQLRLGAEAYLAELRRQMEPLIKLASSRAAGNARLGDGYARLSAALHADTGSQEGPVGKPVRADCPEELSEGFLKELSRVGAEYDSTTGNLAFVVAPSDAGARLRYLGALDQRANRPGTPEALRDSSEGLLPAYARALGELGLAADALENLFEGGPLLPVVVQLSPTTRQLLLEAAETNGLEPPDSWSEHPALGDWLRTLRIQREDGLAEPDAATLLAAFRLAQEARAACAATSRELEQQHHNVKETVARGAVPLFDEIDALIDSYAQLWHGFARLGIRQIAPFGLIIDRDAIDAERHEIVGEASALTFIVRTPGIEIDDQVLVRARIEGVV